MLLIVVAACLGLSAASAESICGGLELVEYEVSRETVETAEETVETIEYEKLTVDQGRTSIKDKVRGWLAEDPVFKDASNTLEIILDVPECKALFDEGYCYYHVGKGRYADIEDVDDLTFGRMKEGVANAQFMGNHICGNLKQCWDGLQLALLADGAFLDAVAVVMADPLKRVEEVMDRLEAKFPEYADYIDQTRDFLEKHEAKSKSEEYADEDWNAIVAFNNITEGMNSFQEWCVESSPSCVDQTAERVGDLLDKLHGEEEEPVCKPATFCEECQDAANEFMEDETLGVPCCLKNVIEKGKELFESWQEEDSYDEAYNIFDDALNQFMEPEDRDRLQKQADCYKDSYDKDIKMCPEEGVAEAEYEEDV